MDFLDGGAGQELDLDTAGERLLAFAADHLALPGSELGQEGLEIRVALIDEVKLLSSALQESRRAERFPFRSSRKRNVGRRRADFFAPYAKACNQLLARGFTMSRRCQEASAGCGGKRHRDLELRIIIQASAAIGVRPAMIEHIFAHGMSF